MFDSMERAARAMKKFSRTLLFAGVMGWLIIALIVGAFIALHLPPRAP